jgi:predicted ArsR family transcriptional regulator
MRVTTRLSCLIGAGIRRRVVKASLDLWKSTGEHGPVHAATSDAGQVSGAKRRLLERLKRVESATATELASDFGLTPTAVRQHLEELTRTGLVEATTAEPGGRGRPAQLWKLTPLAASLFPDRHADLTVSLLESIRETLGEDGIDAVIAARTRAQMAAYRAVLPDPKATPIADRVSALAHVRTVEGYMAEATSEAKLGVGSGGDGDDDGGGGGGSDDSSFVLIEHHCPICEAAESCQSLCRGELALFQTVLGDDVTVERTHHLLAGDLRCAYRITPKPTPTREKPTRGNRRRKPIPISSSRV